MLKIGVQWLVGDLQSGPKGHRAAEIVRFFLTGIFGTLVNLTVLTAATHFVGYRSAVALGLLSGFIVSFLLSKFFTFRARSLDGVAPEFSRFILIYTAGAAIAWGVAVLTRYLLLDFSTSETVVNLTGGIAGASTMALTSYLGHRHFTFARQASVFSLAAPAQKSLAGAVITLCVGSAIALATRAPLRFFARLPFEEARRQSLEWMYYNLSVLSVSYQAGLVRRGLGGTMAALIGRDYVWRGIGFHVLSLLLALAGFVVVLLRLRDKVSGAAFLFMAMFLAWSPQTFMGWGIDIARTDLLAIACIVWSFAFAVRDSWTASALILAAGMLVHETSVIFGAPLIAAVLLERRNEGNFDWSRPAKAAAISCCAGAAIFLVPTIWSPPPAAISHYMLAHAPAAPAPWYADLRDCAIYMLVSGTTGIKTAMCYNRILPQSMFMAAFGLAICLVNAFALGLLRKGVNVYLNLAWLVPLMFMIVIANDDGRWVKFAVVSIWLMSAYVQIRGVQLPRWSLIAGPLSFLGLLVMGSSPVHEVNRFGLNLAYRLGYPAAPQVADWMTVCDPNWRRIVHG